MPAMNIVVCVKQVPDTEVERSLVPGDNTVDRASVDGVINYLDEFAIEGVVTTAALHKRLAQTADVQAGRFDTGFLERLLAV